MPALTQPIGAVIEGIAGGTPVAVSGTVTATTGGLTNTELRAAAVEVIGPNVSTATAISGQITVTTAGTAVQGTTATLANGVWIKALAGNTGKVYVGNDGAGDITASNGFELSQGDVILLQVSNLNALWFDAATNGDKFCWIKA